MVLNESHYLSRIISICLFILYGVVSWAKVTLVPIFSSHKVHKVKIADVLNLQLAELVYLQAELETSA